MPLGVFREAGYYTRFGLNFELIHGDSTMENNDKKIPVLGVSGTVAKAAYVTACLELLNTYKCLNMHALSFGLFPGRTRTAALAAAHRVVNNACAVGHIGYVDWRDEGRYYALTKKGAQHLNSVDKKYSAGSTLASLHDANKIHRTWGTLIAIAARSKAMRGFTESNLPPSLFGEVSRYFGKIPDAVTLTDNTAVWHEVETSRRSTTRKKSAPKEPTGAERLRGLVRVLREKHHVVYREHEFVVALSLHCSNAKIERSVRRTVEQALASPDFKYKAFKKTPLGYAVEFERGGSDLLKIIITTLPKTQEETWSNVFPFTWCNVKPKSSVEKIVGQQTKPLTTSI